jgi:hypothetical protein
MNPPIRSAFTVALMLASGTASASDWTWRGRLQDGGVPAEGRYDVRTRMHSAREGGFALGAAVERAAVDVRAGEFEIPLALSAADDAQPELWIEVAVRGAGEKDWHTLPQRSLVKGASACWSTGGNAGLDAGAFLGTSDADPLNLRSNNQRVMRYVATGASPSLMGGWQGNIAVGAGVAIGGGGNSTDIHFASDNYTTIAGGLGNAAGNADGDFDNASGATVGGGFSNEASNVGATVAGGNGNVASAASGAIGGGVLNRVEGNSGAIGGGDFNRVTGLRGTVAGGSVNEAGEDASVGGGELNKALGDHATVPGGEGNEAIGRASFAAGTGAHAMHEGAFVWVDRSQFGGIESTRANQMRLRAAGGMFLTTESQGVENADLGNSVVDLAIEGEDAQLYLMSANTGNFGSVIGFGEMASGNFANTWGIARETSGGGADLTFHYGTNPVAAENPVLVEFRNDGTAFKSGGGASWDVPSDLRLKRAVAPIEGALDRLLRLHGVSFEYKLPALPNGIALPQGQQLGFIAQQVREVIPEWVGETGDGMLYVGERGSTALLVEALRELSERNAQLEARIAALEKAADSPSP